MRKLFALLTLFLTAASLHAQEIRKCASDEMEVRLLQRYPEVKKEREKLEASIQSYTDSNSVRKGKSGVIYTIPMVFHIVHNYGGENVSDAQIIDEVRILNQDYRKLNPDSGQVITPFLPIAADCEIQFKLATIDPNGNCTNGIDRIVSTLTEQADDNSKLNPWPSNKYLNIWLIHTFDSLTLGGVAAYAYFPGAPSNIDGIIVLSNYVGSIGSSTPFNSRVLTHEIGHYLSLYHPWGGNNSPGVACGDDQVSDTPETEGWTTCNLSGSICNPPIIENVQNYMEYSYCDRMFTQGQAVRMHAALNSSNGGRNNLWTTANLIATGTNTSAAPVCTPNADFLTSTRFVCYGDSIQYKDLSWNGHPTSWLWTFPGGTPSTSTDSMPYVTYFSAGDHDVKLLVTNSSGSDSLTKTAYVHVSNPPAYTPPFAESFEVNASTFPGNDGWISNPDNGVTWTRVTNVGATGTASVRIANYNNTVGASDDWVTPAFDFSLVSQPVVRFKVANAQRTSSSSDRLTVWLSTDCGQSWTVRYSKSGAVLSTAGVVGTSFTPNASQWRQETLSINPAAHRANVRLKFQNISDHGNNTYLDDFEISGILLNADQVEETTTGFMIFPNPTAGASNVLFDLSASRSISLDVKDLAGRVVKNVVRETLAQGTHEIALPALSQGIYLVDLVADGKHHIQKLIVSE